MIMGKQYLIRPPYGARGQFAAPSGDTAVDICSRLSSITLYLINMFAAEGASYMNVQNASNSCSIATPRLKEACYGNNRMESA